MLIYSGARSLPGNSLYIHDNRIHHNGLGFIVESILGGHPGMPQDHGWFEDNKIYSNNENYYEKYVQGDDAPCQETVAKAVGHQRGVVCPAFGFPVGTGGMIIGNHNFIDSNQVWDNWRQGFMLFWVPPALLRGDYNPLHQQDNSNFNAFTKNELGYSPKGEVLPNGIDFYWDEAGDGNCWQDNLTAPGKEVTHNYAIDLPDCGNPSQWPIGNLVKTTQLIPCATYDRRSEPDPAGCDWLDTPEKPGSDSGSAGARAAEQPGDGPGTPATLLAVTLVGALGIRVAGARRQGRPVSLQVAPRLDTAPDPLPPRSSSCASPSGCSALPSSPSRSRSRRRPPWPRTRNGSRSSQPVTAWSRRSGP